MFETIVSLLLVNTLILSPLAGGDVLAQKTLNLNNRQPDPWVNEVFADNIVLTLRYLDGKEPFHSNSRQLREPFETSFTLKPGEVFAFQEDALPEFKGRVVKTTNSTFNFKQGFRSSGWLMGDGVCHLASFINMTAKSAGLTVVAPTNHNFASIADIQREFGTSIFYMPGNYSANAQQNLYIINNFEEVIKFKFIVSETQVILIISKQPSVL